MQTPTGDLAALLKAHFQAGASGFRGRVELDATPVPGAVTIVQSAFGSGGGSPSGWKLPNPPAIGNTLLFLADGRGAWTMAEDDSWGTTAPTWTFLKNGHGLNANMIAAVKVFDGVVDNSGTPYFFDWLLVGNTTGSAGWHYGMWEIAGGDIATAICETDVGTVDTQTAMSVSITPGAGQSFLGAIFTIRQADDAGYEPASYGTAGAGWDQRLASVHTYHPGVLIEDRLVDGDGMTDYAATATRFMGSGYGWAGDWDGIAVSLDASVTPPATTTVHQPKRISIDKSLRMTADQATVEFANEDQPLGWGPSSLFVTNSRMRIYQWYGDDANAVCTFTGLIDAVADSRDVLTTSITCRDMMALLLDQTFGATAPQGADETGAVRTAANGVYLSMEVSAIVTDILDRAGWPTADRVVSATSYVLDEYVIADGTSWADAIIGESALTGLVGYDCWADELGILHFETTLTANPLSEPGVPDYTFRSGEDIVSLGDAIDQYELRTRVKIRGPMTTQTLTDVWREQWRTSKIAKPVGIWYDPSDTTRIRILDRGTKRLYSMRIADRVIISSVNIGAVITYPLGISGDPSDATIYWVLNGPWLWTPGTSQIVKVRKSDNHVLARYNLNGDHWSSIKVSGAYIYLANLTTDHIYRRSKADGSAVDDYHQVYGGVTQANPSGIMIDGTTINVFWSNSGTTARFLQAAEAAPATVTKVVKTAGTVLVGGEMNTTTHTECWGGSDSIGRVAQFTLIDVADVTSEVYAEVVDTALEDELGTLAQSENREHDTHPLDADHAYEIRRDTVDVLAVTNLAQATETAMRRLEKLSVRRRVLDVGIVGNPVLQKTDLVRVEDPVTALADDWTIDTYRSEMAADGTYLGTLALLPVVTPDDDVTDDGDATE